MKSIYKDYVARISNTTPLGLVNITFELIEHHIDFALQNKESEDYYVAVDKSIGFIDTLMESLDMEYKMSEDLVQVYSVAKVLLMKAKLTSFNSEALEECKKILEPLKTSFAEIEQSDNTVDSVMSNASQIYAGLTYGRSGLSEFVEESTKGFEV